MSVVKLSRSRSTLSRKMAVPGGRTIEEALALAEAGLNSHRQAGMSKISGLMSELEAASAQQAVQRQADIYPLAAQILDLAGFFETGPFYQATFSLCDIADRMQAEGIWDWPFITVHVGAMRLILSDDCQTNQTSEAVLSGLEAVRLRFMAQQSPEG